MELSVWRQLLITKKKPILAGNSIYSNLGFTLTLILKKNTLVIYYQIKKKFKLNNIEQQTADKAFFTIIFLKFNTEYKSVITNSDRNISHEKYFKNLKNFLERKSLESDRYYQELKNMLVI